MGSFNKVAGPTKNMGKLKKPSSAFSETFSRWFLKDWANKSSSRARAQPFSSHQLLISEPGCCFFFQCDLILFEKLQEMIPTQNREISSETFDRVLKFRNLLFCFRAFYHRVRATCIDFGLILAIRSWGTHRPLFLYNGSYDPGFSQASSIP